MNVINCKSDTLPLAQEGSVDEILHSRSRSNLRINDYIIYDGAVIDFSITIE